MCNFSRKTTRKGKLKMQRIYKAICMESTIMLLLNMFRTVAGE